LDWGPLKGELAVHLSPAQIAALEGVHEAAEFVRRNQGPADQPARERLMLETTRLGLSRQYGTFYRSLNLAAEEIGRFEAVRMEHEGRMSDIRLAARSPQGDSSPVETDSRADAIATLRRAETARFEAEQRALLGESAYAELRAFEDSREQRTFVSNLTANLALSPTPLTTLQADQMWQVLRELNYQSKFNAEKNDWTGMLDRAKNFLYPAQHAELAWLVAKDRDWATQWLLPPILDQWEKETGGVLAVLRQK
jgi:hypothetical protein